VVSEAEIRRRPGDIVRVGLSTIVVVLAAVAAGKLTAQQARMYDLLTDLPSWMRSGFEWVYRAGTSGALIVVVVALLLTRRWRVVLRIAAAVGIAWIVAEIVHVWVDTQSVRSAAFHAHDVPEYPVVRLAVTTAALLVVAPFLVRPARRTVVVVFAIGAVCAALSVLGLPGDVIGSVAIGWGAAAIIHLAFGTPAATPTLGQVVDALHDVGVNVRGLQLAAHQVWGETRFAGVGPDDEPVSVEVLGRDAADARLLVKAGRALLYRDSGPSLALTRPQQLEHRAYLLLLAARAGVPVSEVVLTSMAGSHQDALLVLHEPAGSPVNEVDASRISDAVLDDVWANVGRLHAARLTHGQLTPQNVLLRADGTTAIVDFANGSSDAPPDRAQRDCVDLLATTAELVGVDRALGASLRALGHDGMVDLLPLMEPAALSPAARHALTDRKRLFKELQAKGPALVNEDPPKLAELKRVSFGQIVMAVATFLGFYLIVNQFAGIDLWATLQTAEVQWVVIAALLSPLPQITGAVALTGAVSAPLPFGPVVVEQFANNFTGLIGGTVANTALIIRFFQKQGMTVAVAASSGVLTSLANGTLQVILVVLGLLVTGSDFDLSLTGGSDNLGRIIVVGIIVAGVLLIVALLIPKLRRLVRGIVQPQIESAKNNLKGILSTPRKAGALFGGQLASQILFALILDASLHAYGYSLPLFQLIVINSLASVVGGMAPVPGGMGVVEAGLIAGLTAAGIPNDVAVATTFTHRLFTAYLPPIYGWFALEWLRRHDYI
jgi:uncharacterized membrane protein YbhN (UPF0104 family)/tRNA A-37 threonylcarbamoyl transferase component Bud32